MLTLDGRGEKATTGYGLGDGNTTTSGSARSTCRTRSGLLYEQVTGYLGFLHSSDEYKVMALASLGKPRYIAGVPRHHPPSATRAVYRQPIPPGEALSARRALRGGPLEQRHYDIAHSLAGRAGGNACWSWPLAARPRPARSNLCMAGGVALNCVMNARLRDRGPFRDIWVQPAAGDAGTALGAALWVDAREARPQLARLADGPRLPRARLYATTRSKQFLRWSKLPYRRLTNVAEETAEILAQDKVIGWFQGRMEFGPRALGARSILASPIHAEMQAQLNEIKDREDFRPVAPVVLEEEAGDWFVGAQDALAVHALRLSTCGPTRPTASRPSATSTARPGSRRSTADQNPLYYDLLKAFQARTGVPVLVNTSFNTRGEPIVCTPRDAVEMLLDVAARCAGDRLRSCSRNRRGT